MDRRVFLSLTPYERHKRMLEDYAKFYGRGKTSAADHVILKSDADALKNSFRFIRTDEDDACEPCVVERTWEQRLARKYYDKLFKEYAICDLSRYKEQKIGMRWRIEKEVVVGKGQFSCANKKCEAKDDLISYEVNFAYTEAEEEKNALVKVRVCPECAYKLNFGRSSQLPEAGVKAVKKERQKRRREAEGLDEEAVERRRRRREAREEEEGAAAAAEGGASDLEEEEEEEEGAKDAAGGETKEVVDEAAFWRGERKVEKSPTRDEEHDAYFAGLFM